MAYLIAEADAARVLGAMRPEICGHLLLARVIMDSMAYCELCEMDREFCGHGLAKDAKPQRWSR